jgi:hypothetical protein
MTDFLDEMDKLAAEIAKKAGETVSLDDQIAAFKALTPYWVQKTKNRGDDDNSEGDNFNAFADRIHSQETGHG